MKIESLELMNFCQHRHTTAEFGDGLTAIIGPNGSGKSNILGAVRFALTGDNPNEGALTANICDRSPETETSFVRLRFSHGAVTATVKRNLRPKNPTAELEIHTTGERIEGARDVNLRIFQIMAISSEVLNEMVIVGQNDIFGFLDKTPAKRAEAFQRLFHTEKAAEVHALITSQLKTVEIPSVAVDIDALRQHIQTSEQQIRLFTAQLGTMPSFGDIQQNRDLNATVGRVYQQAQGLRQRLSVDEQTMCSQQQLLATATTQLEAVTRDLATIEQAQANNAAAAADANNILANMAQWRQQEARRTMLYRQIAETDAIIHSLHASPPTLPDGYVVGNAAQIDNLHASLGEMLHRLKQDVRLLDSIRDDTAECPTCGTSATSLVPVIEQAKARVPLLKRQCGECEAKIATFQRYENAVGKWTVQVQEANQKRQHIQELLDAVPVPAGNTSQDTALLQQVADTQQTYAAGVKELQTSKQQLEVQKARIDGVVAQFTESIAYLNRELTTLPVYTAEQAGEAQRNVGLWDQASEQRRSIEQQLAVAENTWRVNTGHLVNAEAAAAKAVLLRNWVALASSWRDLVHKDAAPRFVAQQNLSRLQVGVNESLEMFQTNYRVHADDGLSFIAHFSHGSRQPAERLSEGQKVILALSFRIALNSMFAENIGALYLDEPTAYLDEHHIRGFEPVLHRLKEFSQSRGLQVVIITHERGLAPLFDAVVEL